MISSHKLRIIVKLQLSKGSFTYYVSQEGVSKCLRLLTGEGGGRGLAYVSKKITILGVKKNKIRVKTDEHHDY